MNLASLVSTLVLVASTATAGLFGVPGALPTPTGASDGPIPFLGNTTWDSLTQWLPCPLGPCQSHNGTDDGSDPPPTQANVTYGSGEGNSTDKPSQGDDPASEPADNRTEARAHPSPAGMGCGVSMNDGRQINGDTRAKWTWQTSERTRKLDVELYADAWLTSPFGSGVHLKLTDGNGNIVASADRSGSGMPMGGAFLEFHGDSDHDGIAPGTWTLSLDVDAIQGSAGMSVQSHC